MSRNIILCSDGTGNTFDRGVSNVTKLIQRISLVDAATQVAVYDQGIGTNAQRLSAVRAYRQAEVPDPSALVILDGPPEWRFSPTGLPVRVLGLAGGYGLKANVREMYCALSELYRSREDRVYLFGFSRGAFTVRALAGLIYRCGLPRLPADADANFSRAWDLYKPLHQDPAEVERFRGQVPMHDGFAVHFLGLWDTVKSYGGLLPVMLPHLRHNPLVATVRHALALDEHRGWFDATTWGQLDSDACGAGPRLHPDDLPRYFAQNIEEVWFRGCHSDVGGGDEQEPTAAIALRWMLGEARACGLKLNDHGERELATPDPPGLPEIHESMTWWWRLIDAFPRWAIDNSGLYARRRYAWGGARRNPDKLRRSGKICLHETAGQFPVVTRRISRPTTT